MAESAVPKTSIGIPVSGIHHPTALRLQGSPHADSGVDDEAESRASRPEPDMSEGKEESLASRNILSRQMPDRIGRGFSLPDVRSPFDWFAQPTADVSPQKSLGSFSRRARSVRVNKSRTAHPSPTAPRQSPRTENTASPKGAADMPPFQRTRSRHSMRKSIRKLHDLASETASLSRSDSLRPRSLSPPRNRDGDNSLVVPKPRLLRVIKDAIVKLEQFKLDLIHKDFTLGAIKFVFDQLVAMVDDLVANFSSMENISSPYFEQNVNSLEDLAQHLPPGDLLINEIPKLLKIIAKPARLVECMEFDPSVSQYEDMTAAEARDLLDSIRSAEQNHIPAYILDRLSTNFGPADENAESALMYSKASSVNEMKFLALHAAPCKAHFEFEKRLSAGAYGVVYLAHHKETNERVAIKKLNKQHLVNKNVLHQVFAERDIMQFARNPFLVNLFCSFVTKDSLYIVMELCPRGDLAARLQDFGCFPMDMARRYFAETVLALEYIHAFGIVHRDLKPDNLILSKDEHIKLTDFGLSKIGLMTRTVNADESFHDAQVLGTPDYIAPEVILGQGYGQAVDWWSMGIILFEFLTGSPPFNDETVELIFDHAINDAPCLDGVDEDGDELIPIEAQDLISLLLEKDPTKRLGTPPGPSHLALFEEPMPGAFYVKEHVFFTTPYPDDPTEIDFDSLLMDKAEIVDAPEEEEEGGESDFFDPRNQYQHDDNMSSDEDDGPDSIASMSEMRDFECVNPHSASATPAPGSSPGRLRRLSQFQNTLDHSFDSSTDLNGSFLAAKFDLSEPFPRSPLEAAQRWQHEKELRGEEIPRPVSHHGRRADFVPLERTPAMSAPSSPPPGQVFVFPSPGQERKKQFLENTGRIPSVTVLDTSPPPLSSPALSDRPSTPDSVPEMASQNALAKPALFKKSASIPASLHSSRQESRQESRQGSRQGSFHHRISERLKQEDMSHLSLVKRDSSRSHDSAVENPDSLPDVADLQEQAQSLASSTEEGIIVKDITIAYDPIKEFGFTMRNFFRQKKHAITKVAAGSTAAAAGLQPGWCILAVNNQSVASYSHQRLQRLIQSLRGDDKFIILKVGRKVKTGKLNLKTIRKSFIKGLRRKSPAPSALHSPAHSPSSSLHVRSPPNSTYRGPTAVSLLRVDSSPSRDNSADQCEVRTPSPSSQTSSREGSIHSNIGRSRSDSHQQRKSGDSSSFAFMRRSSRRKSSQRRSSIDKSALSTHHSVRLDEAPSASESPSHISGELDDSVEMARTLRSITMASVLDEEPVVRQRTMVPSSPLSSVTASPLGSPSKTSTRSSWAASKLQTSPLSSPAHTPPICDADESFDQLDAIRPGPALLEKQRSFKAPRPSPLGHSPQNSSACSPDLSPRPEKRSEADWAAILSAVDTNFSSTQPSPTPSMSGPAWTAVQSQRVQSAHPLAQRPLSHSRSSSLSPRASTRRRATSPRPNSPVHQLRTIGLIVASNSDVSVVSQASEAVQALRNNLEKETIV